MTDRLAMLDDLLVWARANLVEDIITITVYTDLPEVLVRCDTFDRITDAAGVTPELTSSLPREDLSRSDIYKAMLPPGNGNERSLVIVKCQHVVPGGEL